MKKLEKKNFKPNLDYAIAHGYSDSRFWFKLQLENLSQKKWILSIKASQLDEIELFGIDKNGKISKQFTGDCYPFSTREIKAPLFAFNLDLSTRQFKEYYLSIKSKDTKQFELDIEEEEFFEDTVQGYYQLGFLYFGMFLMMIIYNFLLFISIRDITFLYYVFYILTFALLNATINGFSTQFLWGDSTIITNQASNFLIGISTIAIALFSYEFLNVKKVYPKITWIYIFLLCSGTFIIILTFFPRSYKINYFIGNLAFIQVIFEVVGGIVILKKGYKPARFYMLAWGFLFISILIFTLKVLKILPHNTFTSYIFPFGSLMEVVLLSFGLGNKINTIEKEKAKTQKELVKQLQKNEEVRSRIARDLHDDLGSTLSSIRILSEFAENQTKNNPEKVPNLLQKITNSTQKLQENLQDIVWTTQTKDNILEELFIRIRQHGGGVLEAKNINYHLKIDSKLNKLSISTSFQYDIFMIFKEAINNIVKYAQAKNVWVEVSLEKHFIVLSINDDGVGFDTQHENDGNGLKNMPHRAISLGGYIDIFSKIGSGTTIKLSVPVPQ